MSLNKKERERTINELQSNFRLLGKSLAEVAIQLGTTPQRVAEILKLENVAIEDPWILRQYLNEQLVQMGRKPFPYSKLTGDYHAYWFLNSSIIERQVLS
ncbi:DUF2316 family protein [Liquorilactobacillus satsumensis]|uniref:DUF2316 family protein n=1 Tax=Liquorilactobacillus satsumensis DSM 16230 = JCM 12392 TaxID=1423801 RepID=A0A0R1UXH6_9LACO|nr:DUF2316 family protein [Liquorilactobacillus satsumensis]KRL97396.1 hypothetical protein FD50_GL001375 [Liquorilactobacillus satsumensis DSM 16230 = JCM 12392]MCC7667294.1 DUF2316 domain-containing protein [Liquorilactobacillus satsumensis]MCP9327620.1 DUF2316 family protein [Liquorilactobacillus satsumensis]MCP9357108.1 DUF2316 family protein [Liquorilactobacillus satsumensis]MCP9371055.1 DUF2316 family protein [Liquorilactobacillus satsumensis]